MKISAKEESLNAVSSTQSKQTAPAQSSEEPSQKQSKRKASDIEKSPSPTTEYSPRIGSQSDNESGESTSGITFTNTRRKKVVKNRKMTMETLYHQSIIMIVMMIVV